MCSDSCCDGSKAYIGAHYVHVHIAPHLDRRRQQGRKLRKRLDCGLAVVVVTVVNRPNRSVFFCPPLSLSLPHEHLHLSTLTCLSFLAECAPRFPSTSLISIYRSPCSKSDHWLDVWNGAEGTAYTVRGRWWITATANI